MESVYDAILSEVVELYEGLVFIFFSRESNRCARIVVACDSVTELESNTPSVRPKRR